MAFDESLAERVRRSFAAFGVSFVEKKMMGGLCFMVDGKMCVGIDRARLMARIDPDVYEAALTRRGCAPMDFTGKPMRGFVFVNAAGIESKRDLESWLRLALDYNPRAVASSRKKRAKRVVKNAGKRRPQKKASGSAATHVRRSKS